MAAPAVNGKPPQPPVKKHITKRAKRRARNEGFMKTVWLVGHIGTIVGSVLEILSYLLFYKNNIWFIRLYHLTFVFAFLSLAIAVVKKFNGQIPTVWTLLPLENAQYGIVALFWIVYPRRIIKLLPFLIYSFLQTADFAAENVLKGKQRENLKDLVNKHHVQLSIVAAYANIVILLSLVLDVIRIRTGSFISLLMFAFIYRLRVAYNPITSQTIGKIMDRLDGFVAGNSKIPEKYQKRWEHARWVLANTEGTQLVRDRNAPPPKPKAPKKLYGGKDSNLWLD